MGQMFDFEIFKQQNALDTSRFADIDLQVHSYYSDGFVSPSFYLSSYQRENHLKYLSISDHNTLNAYADPSFMNDVGSSHAVIIPCVEVDCHSSMDILVYAKHSSSVDAFKEEISPILATENAFRTECMKDCLRSLEKMVKTSAAPPWFSAESYMRENQRLNLLDMMRSVDFTKRDFSLPKRDYLSKPHLIMTLISLNIITLHEVPGASFKEQHAVIKDWLFDTALSWAPDHMPIDLNLIDQIAHVRHGVSIVAHPGRTIEELQSLQIQQPLSFASLETMLDELRRRGIHGVEAEYRGYSESTSFYNARVQEYVEAALKRGASLYTTAGSDFHGPPDWSAMG